MEVPRLLNIVHEERFLMKWLNDFTVNRQNDCKYDLSLCSVSPFIEKNTELGLYFFKLKLKLDFYKM